MIAAGIMTPVALHLAAQNRNLEVQEIGQAAIYPTSLYSPQIIPNGGGLLVSFTRPSTSPMDWYIDTARVKITLNASTFSYDTNGAWVDIPIPLLDPIQVIVPAANLPGGTLVSQALYYVTLEVKLTNGTHTKNFAVHSKTWKYLP